MSLLLKFIQTLLKSLNCLDKNDTLVKVKSWKPYIDNGFIYWPTVLIDEKHSYRKTISPRWCRSRLIQIFKKRDT